jgi:uncharacterized protein YcfL
MKNKNKKTNSIFIEKPEINESDLEMISSNISNPKHDYKNIIYKMISNICIKMKEKKVKKSVIIKKAEKIGIDLIRVEDSIERLKRSNLIAEKNDFLYLISNLIY